MATNRSTSGEEHARTLTGEMVVNPRALEGFLDREGLATPGSAHERRRAQVEVRTATPEQNPPHGALWLTAVDADVSLKADPVEVLQVLHEAGVLARLKEEGRLPFL